MLEALPLLDRMTSLPFIFSLLTQVVLLVKLAAVPALAELPLLFKLTCTLTKSAKRTHFLLWLERFLKDGNQDSILLFDDKDLKDDNNQ